MSPLSYTFMKRVTTIAFPAALLAATWAALQKVQLLPAPQRELAFFAPYLAFTCGLVLSLAFNRGRVFLALVTTGLFYLVTRVWPPADAYQPHTLYLFASLLIPGNLLLFCFMRERGIFTHPGRMRLAFVAGEAAAVFWVVRYPQDYAAIPALIARPL